MAKSLASEVLIGRAKHLCEVIKLRSGSGDSGFVGLAEGSLWFSDVTTVCGLNMGFWGLASIYTRDEGSGLVKRETSRVSSMAQADAWFAFCDSSLRHPQKTPRRRS